MYTYTHICIYIYTRLHPTRDMTHALFMAASCSSSSDIVRGVTKAYVRHIYLNTIYLHVHVHAHISMCVYI